MSKIRYTALTEVWKQWERTSVQDLNLHFRTPAVEGATETGNGEVAAMRSVRGFAAQSTANISLVCADDNDQPGGKRVQKVPCLSERKARPKVDPGRPEAA